MESRWQYITIASVSEKIVMEPFSSSITVRSFVSERVPVISGQHVYGSRLDDKSFNFISLEHAKGRASGSVWQGDATSTHMTNNAQVALIPETSQYNRHVSLKASIIHDIEPAVALPEHIAYCFTSLGELLAR
jgi:type I restriction enzyme S subunit